MPVALDGWLALAALAVLAGGFLRGFSGFGSAQIVVPVLAMVFGPRAAVAMHGIMEIPVILYLARNASGAVERRTVAPMLAALLLTTPLGALVLKAADPDWLRLAISVAVLGMVALIARQGELRLFAGAAGCAGAAALGGLTQGATGVGGPPVVTALLSRGDAAETARANIAAVMSAMIAVSIASFAAYGLIDWTVLVMGGLAAPLCLGAAIAGSRAFARGGGRSYRFVALALIAVMAMLTLANAVAALIAGS